MKKVQEQSKVNVNNDEEMVNAGLRLRPVTPRDKNVWTKSEKEKELLSIFKSVQKTPPVSWAPPKYSVGVPGKLIVYLSQPKDGRNVISHKCVLSDISDLLAGYKKSNCVVTKYLWNGKEYSSDSLPPQLGRNYRVKV